MSGSRHFVFATFGSLGDVHPFLAIGRELQHRGHRVSLATSRYHQAKIEREGFGFHAVRPDIAELGGPAGLFREFCAGPTGPLRVLRRHILPRLRDTCDDLLAATQDADCLGTHPLFYPAPLVAEKRQLPWAGMLLQPMTVQSFTDPSMFPALPAVAHRLLFRLGQAATAPLVRPVHQLRQTLGLPPSSRHPMFGSQYAPGLNLALFSPVFAPPQADWPPATIATGFPFLEHARSSEETPPKALQDFLAAGPPPLVFTLGSTALDLSVRFYLESRLVAGELGCRAVFLAGKEAIPHLQAVPSPDSLSLPYAPHGFLFSRAAAIIHSGGIGTTAQALRSGRPQLVVPFGFDQPDNARRMKRLGVGSLLPISRYHARPAGRLISALLRDEALIARAAGLGKTIRSETGAATAADALERMLRVRP